MKRTERPGTTQWNYKFSAQMICKEQWKRRLIRDRDVACLCFLFRCPFSVSFRFRIRFRVGFLNRKQFWSLINICNLFPTILYKFYKALYALGFAFLLRVWFRGKGITFISYKFRLLYAFLRTFFSDILIINVIARHIFFLQSLY